MASISEMNDILIVGGGPAGLSLAVNLARSLHSVVVFDSGQYRNSLLPHLHGVVGWDHQDSGSIRQKMRGDLARYSTASLVETTVRFVAKEGEDPATYRVTDDEGRVWLGRKLALATGVSDILPDIPGYEECWVRGIFHCLTSQGFEDRGQESAGVLGIGACATVFACARLSRQASQLSRQVRVYTDANHELTAALKSSENFSHSGRIVVEDRKIVRLSKEPHGASVTVHLEDGSTFEEGFIVHKPKMQVNGDFAAQLGLETVEFGHEITKVSPPFHETSLKGVFAIGDCASPQKVFVHAMSMGSFAAAGLAAQLQMEASG